MAKTTVSKPSKNSSKNISLKVPQLATKTKTIEPDVSCNSTGSSCMEAAKTTVGKKRKNSTKSTPEIRSHGTWSPYMDGIVGTPKSVAEIVSTDEMIDAVLYGLRNSPSLPIFK
ncbi:heat shock protein [Salix suchowensis]|nr:heat shock protein [Salix suchowensis]